MGSQPILDTGEFYATDDDTTPNGSGLFRINANGTGTLITPYPAGQTDIDGLAVSDDGPRLPGDRRARA